MDVERKVKRRESSEIIVPSVGRYSWAGVPAVETLKVSSQETAICYLSGGPG